MKLDVKPVKKSTHLKFSVSIGLAILLVTLGLSWTALTTWLGGETTTGTLGGVSSVVQQSQSTSGSRRTKLNTGTVTWQVGGRTFSTRVNLHLLTELKILRSGDTVTVAYDPDSPGDGVPLDYALFSPMALIFGTFAALILTLCTPQLLYHLAREAAEAREAKDAPNNKAAVSPDPSKP